MKKKITSGKDLLSKKKKPTSGDAEGKAIPTSDELAEIHTPELSLDTFLIADKTFKYKISNIKTQKVMAKSLTAINELISKMDVHSLVKSFRDKMRSADNKITDGLSKIAGMEGEELEENINLLSKEIDGGGDFYVDLVELVKDVIQYGGIDNIIIAVMDLMVGVVYAICNGQDKDIDRNWIEENINFNQSQEVFFRQMKKDEIQGKAIDFLALSIRLITKTDRDE